MIEKERLKKLAEDPIFISGIYNYCDRWCERCPFTSRCLNFEMSKEEFEDKEISNPDNKKFWKNLENIFAITHEMLNEMAEEQGIDLSQIIISEEEIKQDKERKKSIKKNLSAISSKAYTEMAEKWFNSSEKIIKAKEDELNLQLTLNLPSSEPKQVAVTLKDAIEVITYYLFFIQVKIMRALDGKTRDLPEILYEFPKDSDGSAKIALIAIDRSISAWGTFLKYLPDGEDEILKILVHLEQLRRSVESAFPDARDFIRPGFDQ